MDAQTYIGRIDQIKDNCDQMKAELGRLSDAIDVIRHEIESGLTAENIPTLVASLGAMELARTQRGVDYEISDFAGFARFLRGLAAKKRITTWEPIGDPKTESLLALCEKMWPLLFYREMVCGFLKDAGKLDERRISAGMMSLLGALQGDLAYIEDSDERVRNLYSQFSDEVIEPALGISVEAMLTGFSEIRRLIPARIAESIDKQQGARKIHDIFKAASHRIESEEEMKAFLESQLGFEQAMRDAHAGYMIQGRLFVFEPKDFEPSIGDRAKSFLDAFSFTPGEANHDYGSPYDTSVHRSRPFASVGDDYLLFDPCYCYFAPLHRLRECFSTDRLRQRLTKRRDKELEEVADRLFGAVINADAKYHSYYIAIDEDGRLAERDMLLIHNGVAYIVESKARWLRSVSEHKGNIDKIQGDFKKTIQEGYEQCVSVIKYIKSNPDGAALYDSDKPNRQVVEVITHIPHLLLKVCRPPGGMPRSLISFSCTGESSASCLSCDAPFFTMTMQRVLNAFRMAGPVGAGLGRFSGYRPYMGFP